MSCDLNVCTLATFTGTVSLDYEVVWICIGIVEIMYDFSYGKLYVMSLKCQ